MLPPDKGRIIWVLTVNRKFLPGAKGLSTTREILSKQMDHSKGFLDHLVRRFKIPGPFCVQIL